MLVIPVTPNTKPRQTQSDVWRKRKCVLQYRAYKDELSRAVEGTGIKERLESGTPFIIEFHIPIPKKISRAKREARIGQPHRQTPDVDNLLKAFLDSLLLNDCQIWNVWVRKFWCEGEGHIKLEFF